MVDASEYHERTKHSPESVRADSHRLDPRTKPQPYKEYTTLPVIEPADPVDGPATPALAAVATSRPRPAIDGSGVGGADGHDAEAAPPLHTLCHYATGITKTLRRQGREIPYRAAACTGKLYHVDLYAVTGTCGPNGPGVYHFDPHEDRFDVLRDGDYRGHVAAATGGHPAVTEAPITVVASSTWWRNAWKYRERTFRHAFWDSGTILANLLAAAHGLGHRAEVVGAFAEDPVVDLLGLDPEAEAPLELVAVGTGDPTAAAGSATRAPGDLATIAPETAPLSPEQEEYPVVPEAWRQGCLDDGDAAADWRALVRDAAPEDLGRVGAGDGERVALDPVDAETASARPVGTTIERRGSSREYVHEPISDRKLATVLDRALRGVPGDWTAGDDEPVEDPGERPEADPGGDHSPHAATAPGRFVDCYCLIHAVDDVESGTYQYHPQESSLERIGETDRGTAGHIALDQPVVGDAAVNVYLLADVDAIVSHVGNRGYRLAQLEAGVALGRLYLATYAHRSLGGRGFTFYDDLVTEHLSPRADDQTPMTLFAFGNPA
jgi:SagB-type dehydrogenase family enzyme